MNIHTCIYKGWDDKVKNNKFKRLKIKIDQQSDSVSKSRSLPASFLDTISESCFDYINMNYNRVIIIS
jgi:hypothetical protein